MGKVVGGIVSIIVGLVLAFFVKRISFFIVERWKLFFNTKISEKLCQFIFLLVGISFIVTGFLDLFR